MNGVLGRIQAAGDVIITRPLDLGELDEAYRGAVFEVWVAPSRVHMAEFGALTERIQTLKTGQDKLTDEEKEAEFAAWNQRLVAWYADTWRNLAHEEVLEIKAHLDEFNPIAWDWLLNRTSEMIGEYRRGKLGNSGSG